MIMRRQIQHMLCDSCDMSDTYNIRDVTLIGDYHCQWIRFGFCCFKFNDTQRPLHLFKKRVFIINALNYHGQ